MSSVTRYYFGVAAMIAWMSGIFVGSRFFVTPLSLWVWGGGLLIMILLRKVSGVLIILVLGIFLAGILRMNSSATTYQQIQETLAPRTSYTVRIDAPARLRSYGVQYPVSEMYGEARYFLTVREGDHQIGDILEVQGSLSQPDNPAIQRYLQGKNIHAYLSGKEVLEVGQDCNTWCSIRRTIQTVKEWFLTRLDLTYPGRVGEFLKGILIGYTDTLPEETKEAFRRTGVTHILAVSGYNVSIFVVLIYQSMLNWQIHRRYGVLTTITVVTLFTIMTGAEASIIRASLFASIILIGEVLRRYNSGWYPLLLCASIMLWIRPTYLSFDIGFQLSFLAVIGLMLYGNLFDTFSQGLPSLTLKSLIGETVAAQIMVLPILIYHFGEFSLISILANALIVPLIPLAMLWGFVTTMLDIIIPVGIITVPLELLIEALIWINQSVASVPWAMVAIPAIPLWGLALSYIMLGLGGYLLIRYQHRHG